MLPRGERGDDRINPHNAPLEAPANGACAF